MRSGPVADRRWRRWGAVWLLLAVLGAGATAYELLVRFPDAPGPGDGGRREVVIPPGVGPERLSEIMVDSGLIDSPGRFRLWLRLVRGLPQVKAGSFVLADDMSPTEILDALAGRATDRGVRVTLPEGFTLNEIGQALEHAGLISWESFLAAARSRPLLAELGIPGPSAEGYLFPDTYFFDRTTTGEQVVRRMHETFRARLAPLNPPSAKLLEEVVVLASVVQAEARVVEEMPRIAGVYRNRLQRPEFPSRLLQADPTVAYGCEPGVVPRAPSCDGFTGTLGRRQLDDEANPYNTYRHPGLPPGPICAPGVAALRAALRPAATPHFYFVAGQDGRHVFSTTLAEHQRAVSRYRAMREQGGEDPERGE